MKDIEKKKLKVQYIKLRDFEFQEEYFKICDNSGG